MAQVPPMSPEIQRVFDALNDVTDRASPYNVRLPGPEPQLVLRIMEAPVHLDARVQALEARP